MIDALDPDGGGAGAGIHEARGRQRAEDWRVTRDRDRICGRAFGHALREKGCEATTLSYRSPNLNANVERFIQSIRQECLDHFLIFDEW